MSKVVKRSQPVTDPLQLLIDHTPSALAMFDRDMRYLAVSQRWLADYDLGEQAVIGHSHYDIFPDIPEHWKAIHRRGMLGEVIVNDEDRFDRANGSVQWLRWQVRPWHKNTGELGGIIIFTEDISERKWNDTLVQGQNQILAMIAQTTPLPETLTALIQIIEGLAPGMLCSILLLDADRVHVRHGAGPSLPEEYMRAIDGAPIGPVAGSCGTAAFRGEQVVVVDIATDELWKDYRALALPHGLRACWSTPIFDSQRNVLGTFAIYYREPGRPNALHQRIIEIATHTTSIAIVRHRSELVIRQSEERLRLALDAAHMGIFDWDITNGTFVWSRWHEQLWAYSPGEFDGSYEAVERRIHREDKPSVDAELARCMRDNLPFQRDFRVVWPDGSVHWIRSRGEFEYQDGEACHMRGVVKDVSQSKIDEQKLREYERTALQRAILDSTAHAIIAGDERGVTLFNRAAEQLLGYDAEEIVGHHVATFFHDPNEIKDRAKNLSAELGKTIEPGLEVLLAKARDGAADQDEWTYIRKDGMRVPVSLTVSAVLDTTGKVASFVGIAEDIRLRKQVEAELSSMNAALIVAKERAEAADKIKSAFLATMSHELRTPLNSIIGFTGTLLQELAGPLNQEQRKQMTMVRGSGQHLLALINDVLDLSKIEAGQLGVSSEAVSLPSLIDRVVGSITPLARSKGLILNIATQPHLPLVQADPRRVEQVLLNLLSNAIKFTAHGVIEIKSQQTDAFAEISVSDTGMGIRPQDQQALFQPFRQIDSTLSRGHEGTGLGLAICKRLVELMGGQIWVKSELGNGSTFTFSLKVVQ